MNPYHILQLRWFIDKLVFARCPLLLLQLFFNEQPSLKKNQRKAEVEASK